MSTGWIVLGVIVVIAFIAFAAYNRLVALSQRVNQAFADIDVQLKQRHDLIPNLVETVKGYAQHERGTLDDVIKARNAAMSAQGPAQVSAAENQLSGALGRLIADAATRTQVWVISHSPRLIASLERGAGCTTLTLEKELGETRVAGQDLLDVPAWRWPER